MGQKDFLTAKIAQAANIACDMDRAVYLDFYEPQLQLLIQREIGRFPRCSCSFFGGTQYSERKMLCVHPAASEPDFMQYPIDVVQIKVKNTDLHHRDVLGAVMGLSIERDKVGDININEELIQCFIAKPLGEFTAQNLIKIGSQNIAAKLVGREAAVTFTPQFSEVSVIIPSMRIDAVIHGVYKLSRNDAAQYVKSGSVKVNHGEVLKSAFNVKEGDIVSVRTKGRFIVDKIEGLTKKENIKLRVKKFS